MVYFITYIYIDVATVIIVWLTIFLYWSIVYCLVLSCISDSAELMIMNSSGQRQIQNLSGKWLLARRDNIRYRV